MERIKTIGVLSQFDHGIDAEYGKSILEAYSDYDTAIKHMDDEVLSFINELVFRKWDITYTNYTIDSYDGVHQFRMNYRDNLGEFHTHCVILEFIDLVL